MPTGYTAIIDDTENVTFKDYALRCARAFGALVHMRDEPTDKPIEVPPEDTYHRTALKKAEGRLIELRGMTPEQAQPLADMAHFEELKRREASKLKEQAIDARYDAMRAEVMAWRPPTADHVGLKDFMLEQLSTGRPDYCRYTEPKPLMAPSGAAWLAEQIKSVEYDVAYHTKHQEQDDGRQANRAGWVKALLDNLG